MASRACGNRLSLRNQYDTKTPRASTFSQGFSPGPVQFDSTGPTKLASRNKTAAWVSSGPYLKNRVTPKMSVENFLEPGNRKNLPERPNHRRTNAAQRSNSLFNRTTCMSGPQAVREDRFQKCIGSFFARPRDCGGCRGC